MFNARLNPVEGSEQASTRPVIVVSRDAINQYSSVVVVVPVTKAANIKRQYPSNVRLPAGEGGLHKESIALGGQMRAISKKRLIRRLGELSTDRMKQIDRSLRVTLDLL